MWRRSSGRSTPSRSVSASSECSSHRPEDNCRQGNGVQHRVHEGFADLLFPSVKEFHIERCVMGHQHGTFGKAVEALDRFENARCAGHHVIGHTVELQWNPEEWRDRD